MENCRNRSVMTRGIISLQIIVDIILWLAVSLPVLFLFLRGTPVERGFFCGDESLSYPYRADTISTPLLIIAGFGTAISVIVVVEILNCLDRRCYRYCPSRDDLLYCAKGYATFMVGNVVHQLVVETVKNQMGFLRPNFFDVCRPIFNTSLCPGYITEYSCTVSRHGEEELRVVRQSFPSGHAALSMYIATYFSLYIQRRLDISFSRILKFFMQSGLFCVSLFCGLGRISDNKHHVGDVIAGFFVGATVAVTVYKSIGIHLLLNNVYQTKDSTKEPTSGVVCCSCASSSNTELQTPSPLLQNEYSTTSNGHCQEENGLTSTKHMPLSVRRNNIMSTPTLRHEDVLCVSYR